MMWGGKDNFTAHSLTTNITSGLGEVISSSVLPRLRRPPAPPSALQQALWMYVLTAVCVIGIVLHLTSFPALLKLSKRAAILLGTLSLANVALLAAVWVVYCVCHFLWRDRVLLYYTNNTLLALQLFSIWVTVFIGVERCLLITRPLSAKRTLRPRVIIICIVIVAVLSVAFNFPSYFSLQIVDTPRGPRLKSTPLGRDPDFRLYYMTWAFFFVYRLIPIVILVTTTVLSVARLRRSSLRVRKFQRGKDAIPRHLRASRSSFRQSNLLMLAIVIQFIVFSLPNVAGRALHFANVTNSDASRLRLFVPVLQALSCCTQAVLYFICCRRFRVAFRNTYRCYPPNRSSITSSFIPVSSPGTNGEEVALIIVAKAAAELIKPDLISQV